MQARVSPHSSLVINGRRIGARPALEQFPQLLRHVKQTGRKRNPRPSTLEARLRKFYKKSELPTELTDGNLVVISKANKIRWKGLVSHHTLENKDRGLGIGDFFEYARPSVVSFLEQNKQYKVLFSIRCQFHDKDGPYEDPIHFKSKQEVNLRGTNEDELYNGAI